MKKESSDSFLRGSDPDGGPVRMMKTIPQQNKSGKLVREDACPDAGQAEIQTIGKNKSNNGTNQCD